MNYPDIDRLLQQDNGTYICLNEFDRIKEGTSNIEVTFNKYLDDIYTRVEVKKGAVEVLKSLKSKGHKIYIITARNNNTSKKVKDVETITREWFDRNGIVIDEMIIDAYGDGKASACKKHLIDIMIEDNPYNYKKIISTGTKCLLFDDRGRYDLGKDYVTTWKEIEKHIERNN